MKKEDFLRMEVYMRSRMSDSAHDAGHVYRVLYSALDIAQTQPEADRDILIAACLLHDICRADQLRDPGLCHARQGAILAREWLIGQGFPEDFADRVSQCIRTHRFRSQDPPVSIEARILFDADKLDVCGAMGIARTLMYKGRMGTTLEGPEEKNSFRQEYHAKLEKHYDRFYTPRGREIALSRREAAVSFYHSLMAEMEAPADLGQEILRRNLE